MATEIERKYLVTEPPAELSNGTRIQQGYLQTDPARTIRVRTIQDNAGSHAFLTIKGKSDLNGLARFEFETQIPFEDAAELLQLCDQPLISKTRYCLFLNNLTWEIDVFEGDNTGLIIAEVELPTVETPVLPPAFVDYEVTGDPRYYNSTLQKHPYSTWQERSLK